jgi:Na+/phosphate symporter
MYDKLISGFLSITINFGARHVLSDLTPMQNMILGTNVGKAFVAFAIFYTTVRDFVCALALTGLFLILFKILLNETSELCLFKANETISAFF